MCDRECVCLCDRVCVCECKIGICGLNTECMYNMHTEHTLLANEANLHSRTMHTIFLYISYYRLFSGDAIPQFLI